MSRPPFLHDFAITKKYAVFADIQIGMNLMVMIVGGGSPVGSDPSKVSRLGVLPWYAKDKSEIRWFDVPGFNIVHAINAWDEEDAVVMVAPNVLSSTEWSSSTGLWRRYVYAAGDPMPRIAEVVKVDVEAVDEKKRGECTVARRMYCIGCYGGKPFFADKNVAEEEDDGYVVSYVHNERLGDSTFLVMDAKSPELEIVAEFKLLRRVPYGFHGLFVMETDL